jgi:formylglycine-generating enzyme required for sulfatase activity/CheY-like chemotaxis protein
MKILLVDDDEGVVQSLNAILQTHGGYDVRGATTAGQALQSAMSLGGIDLLITDVVMEPMDGFSLRDQMATRYPAAKVIFISGYDLSDYGAQTAGHQVLAKPLDAAELLAAVERELTAEAVSEPEPVEEEPAAVQTVEEPESAVPELVVAAESSVEVEPVPEAEPEPAPEPEPEPPAPVPVAVPVAVPRVAAAAVPVAQPRAVAAARAVPAATPVAVPRAVAAVPTAVKAVAQPTAVPKAVGQPTAVPKVGQPTAVPKAVAQPTAAPRAVAAPTAVPKVAVAGPKAVPKVSAPAVPSAPVAVKPTAVAKAPVASAPKPMAAPKAGFKAPSAPSLPSAPLPDDEMVGQTIGAYEIKRVLGQGKLGRVYAAMQTSVNRLVSLKILDPSQASDEAARTRFLGDARAKAHVQHPAILAVYEAGEANGHVYFTHEYVEGRNLAELHAQGQRFDEPTALKVLKTTAEGLTYLNGNQLSHSMPEGSSIYLGTDGVPRLANLATSLGEDQGGQDQEIQAVGRLILGLLPSIQSVSQGLRGLLSRMVQTGPQSVSTWSGVVQELKALEPKIIPAEAAKISAQDRAAVAAVESARKSQKKSLLINIGTMVSLVLIGAFAVWHFFLNTNERVVDQQVKIPGGPFIFGTGQTIEIPDFWIDKYEVSIGEYGKFVDFLEDHPTSEFDHPKQPKLKTSTMHKPNKWEIYYGRAKKGMAIHSVPSDLNMPAIQVDWWDAYAYAKWKGRELPTEQEWEKAARGTQGFIYPWGNEFDAKKVNANADFNANDPAAPGKVDGFNYWGPVDKQKDKSPFDVFGMAGNVAEWTATWDKENKFPVIKGGTFMSSDVRLDKRTDKEPPQTAQENLGFRTVTHTAPAQ